MTAQRAIALLLVFLTLLGPVWTNDASSTVDFLRRSMVVAVVLGDHVYIHGGELASKDNGKSPPRNSPTITPNNTLSLSLANSWENTDVSTLYGLNPLSGAPQFNAQAAWVDPTGSSFYVWGGYTPYTAPRRPLEIWKFSRNIDGTGGWTRETPRGAVAERLRHDVRPEKGAWTQNKTHGFLFGGISNSRTEASITGTTCLALPRLRIFDMTSGELNDLSTAGLKWPSDKLAPDGTLVEASAEFVPFGNSGLLLFLGGGRSPPVTTFPAPSIPAWREPTNAVDFDNLLLYDTTTGLWHTQRTTGDRPTPRGALCTVGVQGPNNTYEIFMYGGLAYSGSVTTDEVYVLSLPGFVFMKASGASTPRADHSCVLAGSARRQMLSVGGNRNELGSPDSHLDPDPWKNGIGVLDLTEMRWTNRYDANALPYESPKIVRDWYAKGGLESVGWSNQEVKKLFRVASSPPPSSSDTPTSSSSPASSGTPDSSSDPPRSLVGPVVGGVVGGLALALVVAYLTWRHIKRRKQWKQQAQENLAEPPSRSNGVVEGNLHEMEQQYKRPVSWVGYYAVTPRHELSPHLDPVRQELGVDLPIEMPADQVFPSRKP